MNCNTNDFSSYISHLKYLNHNDDYLPDGDLGVTSALDCPNAEAITNQILFETENLLRTVAATSTNQTVTIFNGPFRRRKPLTDWK